MQPVFRHPEYVGLCHGRDSFLILKDEIFRIAVVVVSHHSRQCLARAVEIENETVDGRLLRRLQFLVGHLGGANLLDFLIDRSNRVHCIRRFRTPADTEDSRMIEIRAPRRADAIGVTQLGPDLSDWASCAGRFCKPSIVAAPRGKSSANRIVQIQARRAGRP